MSKSFRNVDGKPVVLGLVEAISRNRDYLSEVDGLIGDGDHGVNMNKGFALFYEKSREGGGTFSESLQLLGRTLLGDIGGSMGPLYGTFFLRMAAVSQTETEIGREAFGRMLSAALEGVCSLGGAQVGDKTLVDCLQPAVEAYSRAEEEGADFAACLDAMKQAAQAGRDSTKDMVARLGRASRLGERSRNVLDAGAVSCCILLHALADGSLALLEDAGTAGNQIK